MLRQYRVLDCIGKVGPVPMDLCWYPIGSTGIGIRISRRCGGVAVGIRLPIVAQVGHGGGIASGGHGPFRIPAHNQLLRRCHTAPKAVFIGFKNLAGIGVFDHDFIVGHDVLRNVFQNQVPSLELPAVNFGVLGQPFHLRRRQLGRRCRRLWDRQQGEQQSRNQRRTVPSSFHLRTPPHKIWLCPI